jgi:hypothetical protein
MENEKFVEHPVDQRTITRRCTERGLAFIKENQERPFFLYLPYSMPHIPLYVPDDVRDCASLIRQSVARRSRSINSRSISRSRDCG